VDYPLKTRILVEDAFSGVTARSGRRFNRMKWFNEGRNLGGNPGEMRVISIDAYGIFSP
jgi:hypothetical protein